MPSWAIYDTQNNRVKQYITSSPIDPTYPVGANEGALKDPNVSALLSVSLIYWKHSSGILVEMTTGEKATVDAEIASALVTSRHNGAKSVVDSIESTGILQRAIADIIKDELNIIRQWTVSFKAAVAASTNLANLQTRVAALDILSDRTLAQLKTAIESRIDSGTVDI